LLDAAVIAFQQVQLFYEVALAATGVVLDYWTAGGLHRHAWGKEDTGFGMPGVLA
jgi:hypothetical protein